MRLVFHQTVDPAEERRRQHKRLSVGREVTTAFYEQVVEFCNAELLCQWTTRAELDAEVTRLSLEYCYSATSHSSLTRLILLP